MTKGILVTDGVDIGNAQPLDFVLDSRLQGGMKIYKKVFLNPLSDLTFDPSSGDYFGNYTHNLGYVPAVLAFQDGVFGVGWQNYASVQQPSANADAVKVYMQTASTTPFCLIIFGEKVSDT